MTLNITPTDHAWHAEITCDMPGCSARDEWDYTEVEDVTSTLHDDIAAAGWQRGEMILIVEDRPVRDELGHPEKDALGNVVRQPYRRDIRGDCCAGCAAGREDG